MGDRRLGWFIFGFLLAGLLTVAVGPVHAQTTPADSDLLSTTTRPARPDPDAASDDNGDDDDANGGATDANDGTSPANSSDDGTDAQQTYQPDPGAAGKAAGTDDDAAGPRKPRPIVEDGDLGSTDEPASPQDGIVDVPEADPVTDGADATALDTRDAADIALFENPPAGYDPLLFQIEDLNPIADNRAVDRLFRAEPYDPVGIKIGSFVLFPEVELGGSYYSNVFQVRSAKGDAALDFQPSARLVSNWNTHALEFRATGSFSAFDQYPSQNDRSYLLETRGRLDITKRANIEALVSHEQTLENQNSISAVSTSVSNSTGLQTLLTDRAEVAYNQKFNRLSLQLRGSVSDYKYGETDSGGVVTSNDDRDFTQYQQTVRSSWEFKPTLSAFTEVSVNQRNYDVASAGDGINRSSKGQRYRAGVSFGNTGQVLRGEVSLGYGVQTPDSSLLRSIDGLLIDANATWRISELTSVLFTAASDVSETTQVGVGGALYRSFGIEARQALRRYLIASARFDWANQSSDDGIIDETDIRETLGLEYYADRDTILFGRYVHGNYDAVGKVSDYAYDEVHLGVRVRR